MRKEKLPAKKIVTAALFTALTFLGTVIAIPTPLGGNINPGDAAVLIGAFMMGLPWCVPAAAVGAALGDLTGYALYAPATLVIKGLMSFLAAVVSRTSQESRHPIMRKILAGVIAELWMAAGYYLYERFLYGNFLSPLAGLPWNLLQGAFAVAAAVLCDTSFKKRGSD